MEASGFTAVFRTSGPRFCGLRIEEIQLSRAGRCTLLHEANTLSAIGEATEAS